MNSYSIYSYIKPYIVYSTFIHILKLTHIIPHLCKLLLSLEKN